MRSVPSLCTVSTLQGGASDVYRLMPLQNCLRTPEFK
jgi:hypothetical protein